MEIEQVFARYFQFYEVIKQLLSFKKAFIALENQGENPTALQIGQLQKTLASLKNIIQHTDPKNPLGIMYNVISLEDWQFQTLSNICSLMEKKFELLPGVTSIQQFEEVKTQLQKKSIHLGEITSDQNLDQILSLKFLLHYQKCPGLMETLRSCIDHQNKDALQRFNEIELAKLNLLEILLQIENALVELPSIDHPSSILLQENLTSTKERLIQAYNNFIEKESAEDAEISPSLEAFERTANQEREYVKNLYTNQVVQLQEIKESLKLPKPADFLEWLLQKLLMIRQNLFGKTKAEETKEASDQENIQKVESLEKTGRFYPQRQDFT